MLVDMINVVYSMFYAIMLMLVIILDNQISDTYKKTSLALKVFGVVLFAAVILEPNNPFLNLFRWL